jgi:transcriptional regulator with PAS, ATPase and Fis domain
VLYADRERGARAFDAADASFATVLAHLLGPALDAARRAAETVEARDRYKDQSDELLRDIERRGGFGALIGTSGPMRKLASNIEKVARTDATVLIGGETGAGKELVAREVHQRSGRSRGPFLALNCAALPETLIESELFGHKKGAFTGADRDRRGIFELARGGTVFLDEIGELPAAAQAKLLRVLEAREVLPVGAEQSLPVDVRLIAATHRDLGKEVGLGHFRQDLFYRLNVFPIAIPALRDRSDDLEALVEHFLARSGEARRKHIQAPTERALRALSGYRFPGNVRELAHLVERAVILADDGEALDLDHLPEEVISALPAPSASVASRPGEALHRSLRGEVEAFERALILRELERDGWNRTRTAKRLDISLRSFMDKLKKYALKEV